MMREWSLGVRFKPASVVADRARQFIDDVRKINAEHGMRSVESEDVYDTAVAGAERAYESIRPAAQRHTRLCPDCGEPMHRTVDEQWEAHRCSNCGVDHTGERCYE